MGKGEATRRPWFRILYRIPARRRALVLLGLFLWMGFVLYPDPRSLAMSVARLINPPVDPEAVRELAATLPDDPEAVEAFSEGYVNYRYSWDLYGLPWYFPTVQEVLSDRAGDCQAEALLTASILAAKGLPFTLRYSFEHVWVDYPGKRVLSDLEDARTAFVSDEGEGWLARLPRKVPVREIVEQRLAFHWYPMPTERKAGLLLGFLALLVVGEGLLGFLFRPLSRFRPEESEA